MLLVVTHGGHGAACKDYCACFLHDVPEMKGRVEEHVPQDDSGVFFGEEEATFRGGVHEGKKERLDVHQNGYILSGSFL
jgi:hypothetical protein